jgi:uncharacterized protein DUF4157
MPPLTQRATMKRAASTGPVHRCACGKPLVDGHECAACSARKRQTGHAAGQHRSGGRSLDPAVREGFERALGHDFSQVRVHADGNAAEWANDAGALAYTMGSDIVFGTNLYEPHSRAGARLLAHELVHVVQQGATPSGQTKRHSSRDGDAYEHEADRIAQQVVSTAAPDAPVLRGASGPQMQLRPPRLLDQELRRPPPPPLIQPGSIPEALVVPELPAPPQLDPGPLVSPRPRPGFTLGQPQLTGPLPFTPMQIIRIPRCIPDRPLTWADFPATMPAGAGFSARTSLLQPLVTVQGNEMFQLQLQNTSSVKTKFRNAATRASNGCAPLVAQCTAWLNGHPGGDWNFTPPATNPCPATVQPVSAPATTTGECDTVIGAACDTAAQAESARLLAHEQGHFNLGCVLVNKANDALRAGTPSATVQPRLNAEMTAQQAAYDHATTHGCDATAQASWEADIAADLPAITIP